jgi:hypothetical protein
LDQIDENKLRDLYCDLMAEIKVRLGALAYGLSGFVPPQPPMIEAEFCYLQLRLICELIALGCLAAHGDIEEAPRGRLMKAWKPSDIMRDMEALHPEFFPQAIRLERIAGADDLRIVPVEDKCLTKRELLDIYGECGNTLHRGSLRSIITRVPRYDREKVLEYKDRVINLLRQHSIRLATGDSFFAVQMNPIDQKVTGKVYIRA